jgi:putative membrane protein
MPDFVGIDYLKIFPFLGAAFVLLFIYKVVHDRLTPFDDYAEMERGNAAAALTRNGAYLGVLVAMSGSLIMSDQSYINDLLMFLLDGVVAIAVFTVASHVFDWIIVFRVNNSEQIQQGNLAVALVEACAYMSLGLIMSASFSGEGAGLVTGLLSAVLFSLIGLGTLSAIYLVYAVYWRRHHGAHRIDDEVGAGHMDAAVDCGSLLLAMSITLWFSISGNFTGWANDIKSYAVASGASVIAVAISRVFARILLSRHTDPFIEGSSSGNVAKSTTIGMVSIGIGFVVGLVTFM